MNLLSDIDVSEYSQVYAIAKTDVQGRTFVLSIGFLWAEVGGTSYTVGIYRADNNVAPAPNDKVAVLNPVTVLCSPALVAVKNTSAVDAGFVVMLGGIK